MRVLWQDMRFALRMLRSNPGFTVVAVFTLTLGIAANTTVFGWIDTVLLNPLPAVGDAQELAMLETVTSAGEFIGNTSYTDYRDYRDNLTLVSGLAVGRHTPMSLGPEGKTERAWGELVSANYFDVLRLKPVIGRTIGESEAGDVPGAHPVAVISYRMWQKRFQGDPGVLGQTIRLNRQELSIIGVAPEGFRGSTAGLAYDVWIPLTMAPLMGTGNGTLSYRGTRDLTATFARLMPGVTIEQAGGEVAALAERLAADYPATNRGIGAKLHRIWGAHNGAQSILLRPLQILMATCILMLLIVCANVANLLLARTISREKELGVRLALGAGRWRLGRQLLTETLVLAGAGALSGALVSLWMGRSLTLLLPPTARDVPVAIDGGLSLQTLGFTVLIALAATVISGLAPAFLSARRDLTESLKEGGRGGGAGTRSHRLRGLLVVSEVALAAVALVGAGLFARSFHNASVIDPGFETENVLGAQFFLSYSGYSAQEQRQFCRTLRERLEAAPGVVSVSYSDQVPLWFGTTPWHQMEVEGYVPADIEDMNVHRSLVPPGYFGQMGIPLLEGRDFTELDEDGAPHVIVVNQTFAKRFFGGSSPVGRRVRVERQWTRVVGMVKDSKYHSPTETSLPFFYRPFRQIFAPGLNFAIFVKTAGDPRMVVDTLRREAVALNPDAGVFDAMPLSEYTSASLYPQRVAANLLGVIGAVSVLLSVLGLYGVMSYAVSERRHEVGIRMALGARPGDVRGLIVRQGMVFAAAGLTVGLTAALLIMPYAENMLVGIRANDPWTFAAAALLLILSALLASYVPARRATRADPMVSLRCQ